MMNFLFAWILLLFAFPPGLEKTSFLEALRALESDDLEMALSKFEEAVKSQPENLQYASEYRQAVIRAKAYDRCLAFFEGLLESQPEIANLHLNHGFAQVDKIPDAGSITQVILANRALTAFTSALELETSWIGLYTRGNSYLFWPKIFNKAYLGVADLEQAIRLERKGTLRSYHRRVYIALGDGHLKMDDPGKAREIWKQGLDRFPTNDALLKRLGAEGEALELIVGADYVPNVRVNTDLREIWENQ